MTLATLSTWHELVRTKNTKGLSFKSEIKGVTLAIKKEKLP